MNNLYQNIQGQQFNPATISSIPYKPITFEKLSNVIGMTYNLSAIENMNTISLPRGGEQQIFFVNNRYVVGCGTSHTAGSPTVTLRKTGYYLVNFSGVLSAASTGLVSTQLYNNGVAIPGALSSITIDTAGSLKNVSFSTIVRVLNSCACIDNTANLTVVNTGLEATYSDAEITIVRLN